MQEFELIRRYFSGLTPDAGDVAAGIGDDCALLRPAVGQLLAITTDALVAGRHFPEEASAYDVGWKALAVNLSDLAAAGAEPRWFTLALTLPQPDPIWLEGFAQGLRTLALEQNVVLVGGDTTQGPLSISITALGHLPAGATRRRGDARPGDWVCVTGSLGDAAAGLALWRDPRQEWNFPGAEDTAALLQRLHRPQPRVAAGLALRGLALAAIDISDGLAGDLQHILDASGCGADIELECLPTSPALGRYAQDAARHQLQLFGGDDYELCVCLQPEVFELARAAVDVPLTRIGRITAERGLRWIDGQGGQRQLSGGAYRHFA